MQPDTGGPVVTIGLKEIYDQLVSLNTKVQVWTAEIADTDKKVADHEARLRSLEESQPARRLGVVEQQVEALKASRWPLPSLAVVVSIAALAIPLVAH